MNVEFKNGRRFVQVLKVLSTFADTDLELRRRQVCVHVVVHETSVDLGDPRTLWANVAGLTQASQLLGYADDRAGIDRAAGRLLEMANV